MVSLPISDFENVIGNGVALLRRKVVQPMLKASSVNEVSTNSQMSLSDGTLYLMMPMDAHRGWMPYLTSNNFSKRFAAKLKLSISLSILLWKLIFNSRTNPPRFYLEV